ncbi:MAG TPA: hypothetical protein VMS88_01280, partial [Terriglobales bacterium]|nr:hypothetical protein [Terriglobales bacterium]
MMRTLAFLLLIVTLAVPTRAMARIRPWVGIDGMWSSYAMKDVNALVHELNAGIAGSGLSSSVDEIKYGLGFGGRLGLEFSAPLTIGVGYERLTATSGLSPVATLENPANAYCGFLEGRMPLGKTGSLRLGVAGGVVSEAGQYDFTMPGFSQDTKVTGSGPLYEIYLGSSAWALPRFGITGSLGYRHARIGEVKAEAEGISWTVRNAAGADFSTDYSGPFARVGL